MTTATAAVAALAALMTATPIATADPAPESAPDTSRATVVRVEDARGDVWATPVAGDSYHPASGRRVGDVLAMRIAHRLHKVVVTVRFAELRRNGQSAYEFALRTDDRLVQGQVAASGAHPAGRHRLWSQDGDRIPCAGLSHRVDYASDVVAFQVPRGCLGTPTWVRVHNDDLRETPSTLYTDNPHSEDAQSGLFSARAYRA